MVSGRLTKQQLEAAVQHESEQFKEYYTWLEKHMPPLFFEEVDQNQIMLIVHNLMGFHLQSFFSQIFVKDAAFVLLLDSPDVNIRILKHYNLYGIRNYQTFLSDEPPPFPGVTKNLRIAAIYFSEIQEKRVSCENVLPDNVMHKLYEEIQETHPELEYGQFKELVCSMNDRFLRSLSGERMSIALDMYFRAKSRDYCQYHVQYNEDWDGSDLNKPSMRILFAWRNTPKHRFLYRLAKTIFRHGLSVTRVNATYVDPYSKRSILIMGIGLNGIHGKPAWEEANIRDFLQELVTLKYFDYSDSIEKIFVDSGMIRGNLGNLLRTIVSFVHQILTHADPNLYSVINIEEAFCRHPDLTKQILELFEQKFDPETHSIEKYEENKKGILTLIDELDTGNQLNDERRKNCFIQSINFIEHTLKTNFYRNNKSAFSFRLDPEYMNHVPYDRKEKFPEIPYAIFFIKGMHFIGFHIRFKDLARGGLRTVLPQRFEQMVSERNNVFIECYNLAYTQQKKNKDIPEGGAKGIIFLEPYERLHSETDIYRKELLSKGHTEEDIESKITEFKTEQKLEYLYQTQRAFIHSLLTLVNCLPDGTLKAKDVVDYWNKPEYIYLGPDENMHNVLIEWISHYSELCGYQPGTAFISSKPGAGINHKEFGVTSFGVNVYMIEMLKFMGIDPYTEEFTVKISGGPDGDVAGNQILNLYRYFPKTAKLLALTDISGTIYDPEGLDLAILADMFHKGKSISEYPPSKLASGGFLLDLTTKKEQTSYAQVTLCHKNIEGKLVEEWLNGNDMNHLFRSNLHQTKTDIFIPAGGRPRTLNQYNYKDFLDETGEPTSKGIVEGANLYLTPQARKQLEERGVLIIKDSSANKGGVICSSYEVLSGLTMTKEEFMEAKSELMDEILSLIKERAEDEAKLLLTTHMETGAPLTDISDWISERINTYTYELLDYLLTVELSNDLKDPLIEALLNYSPPLLIDKYTQKILEQVPDIHKKAIIACYIASKTVYKKGLSWSPSIVDVLPLISKDKTIITSPVHGNRSRPL